MTFALFTGARFAEIAAIRNRDVSKTEKIIAIRSAKTEQDGSDQIRFVGIHPDLAKILDGRSGTADERLFPELEKHGYNWVRRKIKTACQELGITYRRFHGLRHTFATYLLAGGVDIRQAMSALGHSRMETTQRYAHLAKNIADVTKLGF